MNWGRFVGIYRQMKLDHLWRECLSFNSEDMEWVVNARDAKQIHGPTEPPVCFTEVGRAVSEPVWEYDRPWFIHQLITPQGRRALVVLYLTPSACPAERYFKVLPELLGERRGKVVFEMFAGRMYLFTKSGSAIKVEKVIRVPDSPAVGVGTEMRVRGGVADLKDPSAIHVDFTIDGRPGRITYRLPDSSEESMTVEVQSPTPQLLED